MLWIAISVSLRNKYINMSIGSYIELHDFDSQVFQVRFSHATPKSVRVQDGCLETVVLAEKSENHTLTLILVGCLCICYIELKRIILRCH